MSYTQKKQLALWSNFLTNNQLSHDKNDAYFRVLESFLEQAIVCSCNNVTDILATILPVILYLRGTEYTSIALTKIEILVNQTEDDEFVAYYRSMCYY